MAATTLTTTSAIFTTTLTSDGSVARTDAIENFLNLSPGSAVQVGTATPVATGANATFALDLGRVPDSHTFNDALRLSNVDVWAHTVNVANLGLSSVLAIEFADGTTTKTIPPGVTEQLRIRTTADFAGPETGEFRLEDSVDSFFFSRNLPFTTKQAPNAVANLTATPSTTPSPRVALDWDASPSSGVAGYNVYRSTSSGGPYTKLNASPLGATDFVDTSVSSAGSYFYRVMAVATGVTPELESVYAQVSAQLIPTPTAVLVPAGASNPAGYINSFTVGGATIRVSVPAATLAGDVVRVSATTGGTTVTASQVAAGGAQTLDIGAMNLNSLAQGAVTLSAWITRGADAGAAVAGTAIKDTLAQVSGSRISATPLNPAHFINRATGITPGTASGAVDVPVSSMATDTVQVRFTRGLLNVIGSASGLGGSGIVTIGGLSTDGWSDGAITVHARVTDIAGNDSGWVLGTPGVRDTVAPAAPTSARVEATAINPVDYVNLASVASAQVRVTSAATATDTVEARLTSGANSAIGITTGGASVAASVNATALADTAIGGLGVAARVVDAAGNASLWFAGTAGTKDTVAPNPLNFNFISFLDMKPKNDRVRAAAGSSGAFDQLRVFDYVDNTYYPAAWISADASGDFAQFDVGIGGVPRVLGYEVRDAAWNTLTRSCQNYQTKNAPGVAVACP